MKKAVLDIGSNTIRLLIANVEKHHQAYQKIYYHHRVARLGEGLQQTGNLSVAGKQRAMDVFQEVVDVCAGFDICAEDIVAVATAAIREAKNGTSFVSQVRTATGLQIQVIAGDVEARIALSGAQAVLDASTSSNMLLFDIGGASTEFSRVRDGVLVDGFSEKLGVVRLTELYLKSDPPTDTEYQAMKQHAIKHLKQIERLWGEDKFVPKHMVGTAGSVTTMAAIHLQMAEYDANKINNFCLSKADFYALRDALLAKTNQERLAIPAVEQGREDVIVAGVAIVDALFEHWNFEEMITVDAGVLEGLLFWQP